jgi:hypothetical protein
MALVGKPCWPARDQHAASRGVCYAKMFLRLLRFCHGVTLVQPFSWATRRTIIPKTPVDAAWRGGIWATALSSLSTKPSAVRSPGNFIGHPPRLGRQNYHTIADCELTRGFVPLALPPRRLVKGRLGDGELPKHLLPVSCGKKITKAHTLGMNDPEAVAEFNRLHELCTSFVLRGTSAWFTELCNKRSPRMGTRGPALD